MVQSGLTGRGLHSHEPRQAGLLGALGGCASWGEAGRARAPSALLVPGRHESHTLTSAAGPTEPGEPEGRPAACPGEVGQGMARLASPGPDPLLQDRTQEELRPSSGNYSPSCLWLRAQSCTQTQGLQTKSRVSLGI